MHLELLMINQPDPTSDKSIDDQNKSPSHGCVRSLLELRF